MNTITKGMISLLLPILAFPALAAASGDAAPAFPIRVSPTGRYFVDSEGKPVFWLGTTQWELFRGYTLEDAKTILERTRSHGFAFVQVKLLGQGDGSRPNAYGQKPLLDGDALRPNEAYFSNVDAVVNAARERGLAISMTVYHQSYRKHIPIEKARRWAKWLAERYRDAPNIVWSTTPEATQEFVPILQEIAAGLREADASRRLITFKPDPAPAPSSSFIHDEEWLDFNSMQVWNAVKQIYPMVSKDYGLKPVKPTLMAEAAYEAGSEYGFEVTPVWVRRQAYYSYLAGGHHTYGHNDSWRILPTWREALDAQGARQMGILKRIFLARPEWWLLVPDQAVLASGGRIEGDVLHLAARHRDGRWAMVYLADKAEFSVDMGKLKGPEVKAFWVDPRSGDALPIGAYANEGVRSFSSPSGWEDSLLVLEAAAASATAGTKFPLKLSAGLLADSPVKFPESGALPAKYPPDQPAVTNEATEKDYYIFSSPERSLDQISRIQSEMPRGEFLPPKNDWEHLERTRRILTEGGDLRILALGDSIVNDTMRSGWVAELREAYPKANIRATVYVRGGGGCQHYREDGRIAKNVIPRKPDLVLIGGISQKDLESIREVVRQLRGDLPQVEILLATGTFGTVDPRDPEALARAPHSGAGAYGESLGKLAAEERCAYLDMTTPWAEYIRSAKVHPHLFYRDPVHANEHGEQILSKILMAFFGPGGTEPGAQRGAESGTKRGDESGVDSGAKSRTERRADREPTSDRPWFRRLLLGMEVGPTGAQSGSDELDLDFARRFDGREIVRACVRAGSQYLVIWGRDSEWTYYDSKLEPKAPGLRDRDVLREAVDEARKHDLPVIVYCVLQYPNQVLRKHPEWKARGPDGKPIDHLVCFNSPYRDYMVGILAEMASYGIAGFHLDMVDQGFGPPHGCWCDICRKLFETRYGHPMPPGVTWDEAWDHMLEFRCDSSERLEKDLRARIRGLDPKLTVDYNYHGSPPFSWEVGQRPVQHAGNGDFVTGETGTWAFGALSVSLNAAFYRAATPGVPVQVAMQRSVRMYHDQTTRPLNDIRWELFTLLAHGAFVTMIDKTAFDGWLDPVVYDRTGAAFREALGKREHFGQRPVAEVGVYYSSRSRDWAGRDRPLEWMQSFLGAHKALVYEHIPFGIVLDENVTAETLRRFPVVLLANACILSPDEVSLFRRHVEEGGHLIVTGQSGLFGRRGEPLAESSLEELAGAKLVRRLESIDNWVRFPRGTGASAGAGVGAGSADPARAAGSAARTGEAANAGESTIREALRGDLPHDWPFLVKGPAAVFEATTATAVGELMRPHRSLLQKKGKQGTDWPMSADAPVGPAFLVHRVGKGTVVTMAASCDFATAGEHHVVEARKLLRNVVRFLAPRPRVEIAAPANVEAVVTEDAGGGILRVHFLAYNSPPQTTPVRERPYVLPGLIEDAPLYRATITAAGRLESAEACNRSTAIARDGNRIDLTIGDNHEVVVLRGEFQ